jgi:hypothetical protein
MKISMKKNSFSTLIAISILGLLIVSCKNDKRANDIGLLG